MNQIKQIGNFCKGLSKWENPNAGRVYDRRGIAPCLTSTSGGGHRRPHIIDMENNKDFTNIKQATKEGSTACQFGGVFNRSYPTSKTRCGRVQDGGMISPTILSSSRGVCKIEKDEKMAYRVRTLTPLECWRLMGFSDEDYKKAAKVNSEAQLYAQAGNAIVVDVLEAIFKQMIKR